jgi:hypothetical protein
MDDFFHNLASPGWWLGVVVVSFLINLAAGYAKPFIDRSLARFSDRRLRKLEQTKVELDRQLAIIERTPNGVVLLSLEELKLVLGAVWSTSVCILILVLAALPIPSVPAPRFPFDLLLLLIPIPLILTMFLIREANKKALLLKLLKDRHNHDKP